MIASSVPAGKFRPRKTDGPPKKLFVQRDELATFLRKRFYILPSYACGQDNRGQSRNPAATGGMLSLPGAMRRSNLGFVPDERMRLLRFTRNDIDKSGLHN
jgi:hypothetical protein